MLTMMAFKQPTRVMLSARGGRGWGRAGALASWLLAGLAVLLLASGMAVGQAGPPPAPPDPCQLAPNLPYCP
jgi:hypothetical protein